MQGTEQYYQAEVKRLREIIGCYKRKLEDKGPRRDFIREGYDYDRFIHYKVYVVKDIPGDLPIEIALREIRENFLPTVYPFLFKRVDYSNKHKGWVVEVYRSLVVSMGID